MLLVTMLFMVFSVKSQTLIIDITNIRNANGKIIIGIFKNDKSFQKEITYIDKTIDKSMLYNGSLTVKIEIKSGVYGVSILDDENNDGNMEYNFIGIPKEGFGFSNYYHSGIIKPKFENFSFVIGKNNKKVKVKMKYM